MTKVVCISNEIDSRKLTIGKRYKVISSYNDTILIVNDVFMKMSYSKVFFLPEDEYRAKNLKELVNELCG